jgi:hypothetical protein
VHRRAVQPPDRGAHEIRHRLRRGDAERVDHDDLAGAGVDGALVDPAEELEVGSGGVDAEERRVDPVLGREAHRARDPAEHRLARHADRLQLQIGDRRLDHRVLHAELHERLEIGRHRAREAPDLRAEPGGGDQAHGLPVVLGDPWEARLDAVDPELVEEPCNLQLLLRVEHHADGLLAVAQRRVVQADVSADAVAVVHGARPDELAHAVTTPSGKGESFSAPSSVIRKLSSTRRPPPPSQ